jgi:hypothetical protein
MENRPLFWILFNVFIIGLLLLDLLVLNRRAHAIKLGEALGWSAFWITLSLGFNYLHYRCRIRGRFYSGHPGHCSQYVHRLYLQRICPAGAAGAVLCLG